MISPMVWNIFFSIAGLVLGLLVVIIFSPWSLRASFLYKHTMTKFSFSSYWIHPTVIRADYDYERGSVEVLLFNKKMNKKKDDSVPKGRDDTIKSDVMDSKSGGDSLRPETLQKESENVIHNDKSTAIAQINKNEVKSEEKKLSISDSKTKHRKGKKIIAGDKIQNKGSVSEKIKLTIVERIRRNPFVFFAKNGSLRTRCYQWFRRIIKSIFRMFRIDFCDICAGIAFEDPSVSGKVFGYIEGARHALSLHSKNINLQYRPLFVNGQNEVVCEIKISTSISKLISPLFVAVMTFPFYTFAVTWWNYRRFLKKGKDEKRD